MWTSRRLGLGELIPREFLLQSNQTSYMAAQDAQTERSLWAFKNLASEVLECHFHCFPLIKEVTKCTNSRSEQFNSTSQWEECQKIYSQLQPTTDVFCFLCEPMTLSNSHYPLEFSFPENHMWLGIFLNFLIFAINIFKSSSSDLGK